LKLTSRRSLLHGGIAGGSVTELVGESTVGKTQLCLQLLLTAQLPVAEGGLGGRALYISTEGKAPLGRLAALASSWPQLAAACDGVLVADGVGGPEALLEAVQAVRRVKRVAGARRGRRRGPLPAREPVPLPDARRQAAVLVEARGPEPPVRLLVLDSVTAPFRDFDAAAADEGAARSEALYRLAAALKRLAHRCGPLCAP